MTLDGAGAIDVGAAAFVGPHVFFLLLLLPRPSWSHFLPYSGGTRDDGRGVREREKGVVDGDGGRDDGVGIVTDDSVDCPLVAAFGRRFFD